MPISYDKLLKLLEAHGITSYTLTRKNRVIGAATWEKLHTGGHIDTRSIEALCRFLDCQPGDLLEYIPEQKG